jgi:hypothetical protein
MTPAELLDLLRFEVSDQEEDFLWATPTLYGYIDEAQKQFCRQTYGIEDARGFKLTVTAAKIWYDLDPLILQVRSAWDATTGAPVPLMAVERMPTYGYRFDGSTGAPKALITGMEKRTLRLYPVPVAAATINLSTFRLPETISSTGTGEFEIDEQHHRHLMLWAKHRCYGVQDSEVYDKKKSMEFKQQFDAYCFTAKTEQDRMNRPVGTVSYGGI